jgi:hypothetical protein
MLVSRYWVVPNFIPSQDGHILGDPVYYHELALSQVYAIQTQGWPTFQLHYEQQGNVGITSLLYLITPNPLLVVILNALLHAIACTAVTRLLLLWFSPIVSLLATLPLLFSFVNVFWLAQINKESYVIAGCALFFLGYTLSLKYIYAGKFSPVWIVTALGGIFLIYIPRPHMNQMLLLGFITTMVIVVGLATIRRQFKVAALGMTQTVILGTAFAYFSQGGISESVNDMIARAAQENRISQSIQAESEETAQSTEDNSSPQQPSTPATVQSMNVAAGSEAPPKASKTTSNEPSVSAAPSRATERVTGSIPVQPTEQTQAAQLAVPEPLGEVCYRKLEPANWRAVDWLPAAVNARIKALADLRCHNHELHDVQDNATTKQSIADADHAIEGVADMIAYAPRGLQLGFFGPLPSQWPEGSFLKSFFYTVVPIMMVFFYIATALAAIWVMRGKAWLALPLFTISLVPIWILGISNSFFGSLFRYRYPVWIILFCFCTAALLTLTLFRKHPRDKRSDAIKPAAIATKP